ncbi:hypothetical protein [Nocardia jejuensis]|uniref:hypothetical protein n=1 Tax=Nocardia jejuensis TaxID=328049 RepID=UPI00082CA41B|nr:hypothetical protein [Nocardia jejuensis]
MKTRTSPETDHTTTRPDPDRDPQEVVHWPDPSPLRPWWDTVMGPAMPAPLTAQRSPTPRHPHARNPHVRPRRLIGASAAR